MIALSQVTQIWQFYVIWLAMGVMMSVALYEACFAIITVTVGAGARTAITTVTLVGGFAGTISFPAAHFLAEAFGWRGALMCFGLAVLVLAIPLMLLGLRRLEHHRPAEPEAAPGTTQVAEVNVLRRPAFWCLAVAFSSIGLTHGLILAHLLPILADRGISEAVAVLAASMIGPMQVAGRIVTMATEKYVNIFGVAIGCYGGMALGSIALLLAGAAPWLVTVFVVLHGAGYGTASICARS